MMPFSSKGDRIRPGQNRRAKEISMVIQNALTSVVNLDNFPNAVVDVFIEFPQTDAGTRCAGINAAAMALADAGIEMKDLISSVAVGRVDDKIVSDLIYDEEAYPEGGVADIPVAMIAGTGNITLLQMDGNMKRDQLKKALEMAKKNCLEVNKIQRDALKARFSGDEK
jgi:exosome complex component RRP41